MRKFFYILFHNEKSKRHYLTFEEHTGYNWMYWLAFTLHKSLISIYS